MLVAALGTVQAFERVAAQTIIFEIVGTDGLSKAASVGTIALGAARSVGPALAGLAFQGLGAGPCSLINAGAYLLVFTSRWRIRPTELHRRALQDQHPGPTRAKDPAGPVIGAFLRSRDVNTLLGST